ncbi:hypothetical protein GU920_00045 [Rhodobacter sp. CCP-1]|uniref:Uncharacterized protein n=2 Tax=Paragemmobacter ruber TaxID=1985673 RepID=A0ABW9Y0A8_9RHOB|nr:hypothetical protein [Rhodobacter ruber]
MRLRGGAVPLVAALAMLAGAYGWGWSQGAARVEARVAAERAAEVASARARERALVQAVDQVARDADEREAELRAAAAGAAADLVRLQRAIVSAGGAATAAAAPGADAPAVAAGFLGECAAQLVEVAERADGYARQLIGLQAYVERVCR